MIARSDGLQASRRRATEDKILDALEVVLVRDGIRQMSLNAIVAEAGVGKPLLYRYFGDLPGLLHAWVARRGPQPSGDPEATVAIGGNDPDDDDFLAELADQLVGCAEQLRKQPIILEMLAEELTAASELTEPFSQARQQQSKRFVRAMLKDARYTNPQVRSKIILLYAAINYLAMRARRSPRFMGLRLDTRRGWTEAMEMIRSLVQR